MTGPRTVAPVLQMVHLQIGCLEQLRRHFQLEATYFIGGLWPPKSYTEGGACQKREARPTALPRALGGHHKHSHTPQNLLIDLSGISCFQPLGKGGPVPRGVPWLLTHEEVWNDGSVKQGRELILVSSLLGLRICFHSRKNMLR